MAHFLHGCGAELTADDYTKATAAISVMEAFGISVAGGSFTHKLISGAGGLTSAAEEAT